MSKLLPLVHAPFLTADCGLELGGVVSLATQLDLHEGVGDAAPRLGQVSGCQHLQEVCTLA